jgi:polyvinyl alcohol dehydrogenase (cytochrome)
MQRYGILVSVAGVIAAIGLRAGLDEVDGIFGQWRVAGENLGNTRSASDESQISPSNAASLAVKWTLTTGGDVSATPTVFGNAVFVPDWAGNVYAIDRDTGQPIWTVQVPQLDGYAGAVSRSSPAIHGDDVIIGDIENDGVAPPHKGANLIALNRKTGKLHWITQVDNQGMAIITGSPVVYGDVVYVGISSNEEIMAIPNS